jgi:hypothetical protein
MMHRLTKRSLATSQDITEPYCVKHQRCIPVVYRMFVSCPTAAGLEQGMFKVDFKVAETTTSQSPKDERQTCVWPKDVLAT